MLSQSVPLTEITRFPLVSTMSIDDHELCDDSSLRATKTVAWQRLKQALCFSLGYSITLWKSFSHICWIRAILLEIFIKNFETSLSHETMTTASDLHHFRVQTPSFLISSSSGDLPVEVWTLKNFIKNSLKYLYYLFSYQTFNNRGLWWNSWEGRLPSKELMCPKP